MSVALAGIPIEEIIPFGSPDRGLIMTPVGLVGARLVQLIIKVLAWVHPLFATMILLAYVVSFAPLVLKKRWKERKLSKRIEKKKPGDSFGLTSGEALHWLVVCFVQVSFCRVVRTHPSLPFPAQTACGVAWGLRRTLRVCCVKRVLVIFRLSFDLPPGTPGTLRRVSILTLLLERGPGAAFEALEGFKSGAGSKPTLLERRVQMQDGASGATGAGAGAGAGVGGDAPPPSPTHGAAVGASSGEYHVWS